LRIRNQCYPVWPCRGGRLTVNNIHTTDIPISPTWTIHIEILRVCRCTTRPTTTALPMTLKERLRLSLTAAVLLRDSRCLLSP
jgi:hypothetical protein